MHGYRPVKRWGDRDPQITPEYLKKITDLVATMSVNEASKLLGRPTHSIKRIIARHTMGVLAIRAKYKEEHGND